MFKTILVPARGDDSDIVALAAALAIARPFSAHIDALHVKLDAANVALAVATDPGSGALTAGLIDRLEEDAQQRASEARTIFEKFCADNGVTTAPTPGDAPSAQWHVETGEEPRWVSAYGLGADLIVAPRGADDRELARSTLEAVLLESGRPLLIPATTALPASFERIAIAWKATAQTARAVALAMPFVARAREVIALTVAEPAANIAADEPDRLVRNLVRHGVAARSERLLAGMDGPAATLLAAAHERADLLIMGGYGHHRLREWVFGGFTQHVLADAPLPVLIAH